MIANPVFNLFAIVSYRLFGSVAEKIKTPSLELNLKKSRMYISSLLYKSMLFFLLFLVVMIGILAEICVYLMMSTEFIEELAAQTAAILVFLFLFVVFFLTFLTFSFLPSLKAYDRKIKIEQQLPFAVNYMAAMAIAGVSVENIFHSMSQKRIRSVYQELSDEMKTIEIQTKYFGFDYPSALLTLSKETASPMFSDFINSSKNTIISGGSFQKFIIAKKHEYRSLAAARKEKYFQTLEMLSEIYITIFLAMPIFFMILFYTLAPLSGSQTEQMKMLTYQLVPFLGFFFLLILEIVNEKEDL
ncbi:hypothetical protein MmiEs2_07440 [Methanimicrococcus stummii]|uniref:Type II secretion system protein GspF domain-containing protein n=1 Tax=Methanimicrococcus stummii TaxID=3028294 RepID=A0AA96ZY77_9EURY|nr:type II secretion system F family protein [Methanimicrococcus sp. Es2]WNY28551.1 hypothetical protein MmiEs2_07440 [Methanimicrococcus sp. Es2]